MQVDRIVNDSGFASVANEGAVLSVHLRPANPSNVDVNQTPSQLLPDSRLVENQDLYAFLLKLRNVRFLRFLIMGKKTHLIAKVP